MTLEVTTFQSEPVAQPLVAEFDEMGGSIGRADGNTLVLPDAKRYISRSQASIRFRGGTFLLRDAGSATPTYVNQTPVGNGNEVTLNDGDELRIGEYTLSVGINAVKGISADGQSSAADPFPDLHAEPPRRPAPAPISTSPVTPNFDDPFARPAAGAASDQQSGQQHVIPQDFDPFADLSQAASSDKAVPGMAGLGVPAGAGVDDLFGLKQPSSWDPLGPHDPVAGSPHGIPGALSDNLLDPLNPAFAAAPRQRVPSQRDDAPPLSGAFRRPNAKHEQPRTDPVIPPDSVPPAQQAAPGANEMVFSWEASASTDTPDDIKSVIVPSPKEAAGAENRASDRRVARPAPPAGFVAPAAPAPAAVTPSKPQARDEELLKAFLTGAGADDLRLPDGLTPELMNLLGSVLREAIGGTLQLLLARALTKREVRAEATVIVAKENNPLKFSPTVEAALTHLLMPHGRGFMPPVSAVRDAYNDLRSHQFGIMAGMRAALTNVLARFNPAQLEQRLTQKRVLSSFLPSGRKAKLWELYEQLYTEISREAEDDFQTLFGKEFLKAYEAQIQKLEQEDSGIKS